MNELHEFFLRCVEKIDDNAQNSIYTCLTVRVYSLLVHAINLALK